jgi:MFS family permease
MAYAGFAVFGAFWGTWGASLPAIRDQAGVTDGQLGTALLFVGAGALPAMLVAGRAVDRWPHRATAAFLTAFGGVGVVVAAAAHDMPSLCVALAFLGAASGAADVAINAAAGSAQRAAGGSVVTRAHATFSAAVVLASLAAGAMRALGMPVVTGFVVVAVAAAAVAAVVVATAPERPIAAPEAGSSLRTLGVRVWPLLVLGGLGAVAFAVENAHQSWSALYLGDVLDAGPALAAGGPAIFAAVVAATRFAAGAFAAARPTAVMVGGSLLAAGGTAVLSAAANVPTGLLGLALAAAGTAVLFPTLLNVLTARVDDGVRGSATSVVTTVSYLGFLAGPVYVGRWADAVGLSGAMLAVAALAVGLALLGAAALPRLPPEAHR